MRRSDEAPDTRRARNSSDRGDVAVDRATVAMQFQVFLVLVVEVPWAPIRERVHDIPDDLRDRLVAGFAESSDRTGTRPIPRLGRTARSGESRRAR